MCPASKGCENVCCEQRVLKCALAKCVKKYVSRKWCENICSASKGCENVCRKGCEKIVERIGPYSLNTLCGVADRAIEGIHVDKRRRSLADSSLHLCRCLLLLGRRRNEIEVPPEATHSTNYE